MAGEEEKRRRYGGPKAKIGAYKPGVVPKLRKIEGRETEHPLYDPTVRYGTGRPEGASELSQAHTSEGSGVGGEIEMFPTTEIVHGQRYRVAAKKVKPGNLLNRPPEEMGKWYYYFAPMNEQGEIDFAPITHSEGAYDDPMEALEAGRKHARRSAQEEADRE